MSLEPYESIRLTLEARLPCGCCVAMANAIVADDIQPPADPAVHLGTVLDIWLDVEKKRHVCAKESSHAG